MPLERLTMFSDAIVQSIFEVILAKFDWVSLRFSPGTSRSDGLKKI